MNKKGLKLVGVASAAMICLAACGGNDDNFDTPGGSSPTQTSDSDQPEPTNTPSESDTSGSDDTSNGDTDTGGEATSSDIDLASDELPVTAQDALDISADEVGSGDAIVHAIEVEYSRSGDMWEWSVKTLLDGTDHKVKINADTGEVTKHEKDSTDDQEKAIDLEDPMPFSKAKDLALDARDGRITSWKYEWDDNRYEYEFDIEADGNTEEVNVNAETGDVRVD